MNQTGNGGNAGPPRVVFDASVLGRATRFPEYRTGIFRVVEHLAHELAASGQVDLALSSLFSPQVFAYTGLYLGTAPGLRGVPLVPSLPGLNAVRRMLEEHHARRGGPGASAATKVYRRVLLHGRRALQTALRPLVPPAPGGDVFHSPRYPLPAAGRTGRAVRFLTVYDLIPLVTPQLCPDEARVELGAILGSLRPDDWAFAISESAKADLCGVRRDLDPARVVVTYLAADPATFHPEPDPAVVAAARARYGIPDGPYLLSLNSLEPRKNMERTVQAFARMVAQEGDRELRFVLVGFQGSYSPIIMRAVAEAGVDPARVVLAGYVADEDLAPLYSGALAFVYPSLYEGFGLPPLEAMQCGVPVITSNLSSLPEVVGGAGIMVDPTDVDALAQAMLDVYRDSALREGMRARSLARAAEFSWKRCAAQTIAGYRMGLAGR